jgi:hypothetical protein
MTEQQHTGHTVNGKHTKVGDSVHYTASDGNKHKAQITALSGNHADLSATIDGQAHTFTAIPHSAEGSAHTWDHEEDES